MCSPTIAKSPLEHYWHQGAFGPSGAIRTLGPVNPNHVRYQLRYTRIFDFLHDTMRRKKKQVFRVCGQCCGQARFCRNFSTGKFPPQATVPRTSGLSLSGEWIGHLSSQIDIERFFALFSLVLRRFCSILFAFRHSLKALFPYTPRHSVAETVVRNASRPLPSARSAGAEDRYFSLLWPSALSLWNGNNASHFCNENSKFAGQ